VLLITAAQLSADAQAAPTPPGRTAEPLQVGREIFAANCAGCHEPDLKGSPVIRTPNLTAGIHMSAAEVENIVRFGIASGHASTAAGTGGLMPAFEGVLDDAEIKAVSLYIRVVAARSTI